MTFGHKIKELRLASGMTVNDLSMEARVPYMTITRLERNLQRDTRIEYAVRLCRALGTTVDDLVDELARADAKV